MVNLLIILSTKAHNTCTGTHTREICMPREILLAHAQSKAHLTTIFTVTLTTLRTYTVD